MGQSFCIIATLAFLVLHICPLAALAAPKISPPSSLPPALQGLLSPLTRNQVDHYGKLLKRGGANTMTDSVLYEFCKSARLLCGSAPALRKSVRNGVISANIVSPANFPTSDGSFAAYVRPNPPSSLNLPFSEVMASAFRTWLFPPSSISSRMGEMEAEPTRLQQQAAATKGAYFHEKDLVVGAKLVLPPYLYEPSREGGELSKPSFLPASLVLSLPPFDSHHLSDLLQLFRIPSDSPMAQQVKNVLVTCDQVQNVGKDDNFIISFCATSFEAMLNFASSILGAPNNMIQALTNSRVVGRPSSQVTIVEMAQLAAGHDAVDCHDLTFPFRVMGCHIIKDSNAFKVRVASEESLTMDLLVACHKNTTLFNPQHQAFWQLKSSPGHTDICHWLSNNDNMWIPL